MLTESLSGLEAMLEQSRCSGPWANRARMFSSSLPQSLAHGLDGAALITKSCWGQYRRTSDLGYGAHYVRVPGFVQFSLDGKLPPTDMSAVGSALLSDITAQVGLALQFRTWNRGVLHDASEDGQREAIFSAMGDPALYPFGSEERRERSIDYVLDHEEKIFSVLLQRFPEQQKFLLEAYGSQRERRLAQELLTPGFRSRSKLGAHGIMTLNRMMRWKDWSTFRAAADCMIVKIGDRGTMVSGSSRFHLSSLRCVGASLSIWSASAR